MRRRPRWLAVCAVIALTVAACGTPQAVKDLSGEQLRAQQALRGQLAAYFDVIERFVQAQIEATSAQLDSLSKQNIADRRKIALKKAGGSITSDAPLADLTRDVVTDVQFREKLKAQLNGHLATLKAKHAEFKEAYGILVDAQTRLDEYLRLEKTDERIANSLLGALGLSRERLERTVNDLVDITGKTTDLLARVKKLGQ
ncbi:MAG: hypothetical protein ACE5GS_00095 [Kiloniellaceae bacterium]